MLNVKLLIIINAFKKWKYYLNYFLNVIKIFINYLNLKYLKIKVKLNDK